MRLATVRSLVPEPMAGQGPRVEIRSIRFATASPSPAPASSGADGNRLAGHGTVLDAGQGNSKKGLQAFVEPAR